MDFWERVNELLKSQKTTQDWLASQLGVKPGGFRSAISRGQAPSVYKAYTIAKALGVSVEYLVTGEDTACWRPPSRIASIVDDLLVLDDLRLSLVSAMVREAASTALPSRQASSGGG